MKTILFPVLAGLGGAGIALLNHFLTRKKMQNDPNGLPRFFLVRQVLNLAYLGGVYLLSEHFGLEMFPLLLGAAVGLTIPSVFLAYRLSQTAAGNNSQKGAKR